MDKVVDLFSRVRAVQKNTDQLKQDNENKALLKMDFASIAARNAEVQEKLRKERLQANKSVLKSYRIK